MLYLPCAEPDVNVPMWHSRFVMWSYNLSAFIFKQVSLLWRENTCAYCEEHEQKSELERKHCLWEGNRLNFMSALMGRLCWSSIIQLFILIVQFPWFHYSQCFEAILFFHKFHFRIFDMQWLQKYSYALIFSHFVMSSAFCQFPCILLEMWQTRTKWHISLK